MYIGIEIVYTLGGMELSPVLHGSTRCEDGTLIDHPEELNLEHKKITNVRVFEGSRTDRLTLTIVGVMGQTETISYGGEGGEEIDLGLNEPAELWYFKGFEEFEERREGKWRYLYKCRCKWRREHQR